MGSNPAGGMDVFLLRVVVLSGRVFCDRLITRPTKCGVSECDFTASTMKRPRPTRAVQEWQICMYICMYIFDIHGSVHCKMTQ